LKRIVLLVVLFVGVVLGVIVYSTLNLARYRVEVCVTFHGHSQCRTASADSEEHALRAASSNACALIASGVTDSIACEHTQPDRVTWLKK
jgi:hypothetical protein